MKTNDKKFLIKAAGAWGICAVVPVLLYLCVVYPTQIKAAKIRKQVDGITAQYDQAMEFVTGKHLERMRRQVDALQDELDTYLVAGDEARSNAFRVSQVAEKTGIKGFSTKHRTANTLTPIDNCNRIAMSRIEISFKGMYEQFAVLINEFERHKPVVLVDSFMISRSDRDDELHDIGVGLTILVDNRKSEPAGLKKTLSKI